MVHVKRAVRVASAALTLLSALPAHAQRSKAQCAEAYTGAQELRLVHRPRASLEKAYQCAAETCPEWMRQECGQWIRDAEAAIPSIVVAIQDASGRPYTSAGRLVVDDVEVDMATAERPTDLDPGEHTVRLELVGRAPVEARILLREGEKSRRVVLTVPEPIAPTTTDETPPVVGADRTAATLRPIPWTVFATGGAALVGGAVFAVFGASGVSAREDLYACRPNCPQDRIDDVSGTFTVATVALGFTVTALAATAILYVTRPSRAVSAGGFGVRF